MPPVTRARSSRTGLLLGAALLAGGGLALGAPGDLTIVSRSSAGALGASPVDASAVSADGRVVAFTSAADLTGTPTGGKVQLYVRDRTANTTALASSPAGGGAANGDVDTDGGVSNTQFAVSGDGRYVVFASTATNLTPADTDATLDVFRKDLQTGAVTLVSVNSAGAKANAAVLGDPDVSSDGNRVVFGSGTSTNLFPSDAGSPTPADSDTVVRDIAAGTTTLVSQSTGGVQANGPTERPAISADGRVVAFTATGTATNLSPSDTGAGNDIYVRNLATGTTSAASDPALLNGTSNFPDISGDGRYVVWETGETYDATNDVGGNDVYRRDMGTGTVVLVSARDGVAGGGNNGGTRPQISANGDRVVFTSTSTDLVTDANAATADIFTRDVAARVTRLASVNGTNQGASDTRLPAIAANGGLVSFLFTDGAGNNRLVTGDTNLQPDAHAKELSANDADPPALTLTGPADGASVSTDRIAVGGTASDPSGIVGVTVGGTPVTLTATGGFSTSIAAVVGANAVVVVARDGAGNTNVVTRTVTRSAPSATTPRAKPRVLGLAAVLTKAGRVRVTLRLSAEAKVRVSLLRRTVRTTPRRKVVLRTAAPAVTRTLAAGRRTVLLTPRRTLAPGRYVVRARILGAAAGPALRTLTLRVAPSR